MTDRPNRVNPFAPFYSLLNSWSLDQVPDFPLMIDVELTNTCNFHCLMCHTGTRSSKRKRGMLSEAVYEKFLSEIRPHRTPLRFIRWGEPTLHPRWLEYMARAKEQGSLVHFNTNGSMLTDENIKEVLRIGVDSVKFSFQGVDAFSYAQMRNTDFYESLLKTVARFHELRGDALVPYLHVSTTTTWESQDMIEAFKRRISPLTDLVTVGKTVLEHLDAAMFVSEEDRKRFLEIKNLQSIHRVHVPCPEVFGKLSLNWDGSVSACCGDYDNLMLAGDLNVQHLAEIWNSSRIQTFRSRLARMEHDRLPLCRFCWGTPTNVLFGAN